MAHDTTHYVTIQYDTIQDYTIYYITIQCNALYYDIRYDMLYYETI